MFETLTFLTLFYLIKVKVYWQKAFDRVDWTKLLEVLRNIGVNWRECRLIRKLYMGQRVKLRLNQGETDIVKIRVRQGCCM